MIAELQRQIARAVLAGFDIDEIEQDIIEQAPLTEDERSALWLYAQALTEHPGERELSLVGSG